MAGSCPVRGGLLAALRAARVLGLAPVRIVETADGDRVVVTACGAAYGYVLTGTVAVLAVLAAAWTTYNGLVLGKGPRSYSWYGAQLTEVLVAALLVLAAGASGSRRMARMIGLVNEIQTINVVNKIDILPKEPFGKRCVWATLAAGVALQGVSLFTIVYCTWNVTSIATFTCMNLPNIFKPVLVLHYVCLAMLVHSPLKAARDPLEEAVLGLGTGEEYDNVAYRRAYEAVRGAHRSYLAACSMVRRLSSQEGPLVLLLLASSAVRTLHCIYLVLSSVNSAESTATPVLRTMFASNAIAWIVVEVLLMVLLTEMWGRVAAAMSSLSPPTGGLLQRAAPRGALAELLGGLQHSLELGPAWFSPLDVCTLSRPFMVALLSFYTTAAAVMRQFNLRDYV